MNKSKVALVLSSGGARGLAHIGVIEELTESGFDIASIAGTSMGSLVGGMYAKGTLPAFKEWLLRFTRMDVLRFLDLTTSSGGMIKGEKIMKAVGDFVGEVLIEDMPIPFSCVAADLLNHTEVVFAQGSLLNAIRASCAIPTVFMPVKDNGRVLVDGGILNPLPLNVVKRMDKDILVAVNVNAQIAYEPQLRKHNHQAEAHHYNAFRNTINQKWNGLLEHYSSRSRTEDAFSKNSNVFDIISDSINLSQNKLSSFYIQMYKPDILIDISYKSATIFDFYKSDELIEAGKVACRKAISVYRSQFSENNT